VEEKDKILDSQRVDGIPTRHTQPPPMGVLSAQSDKTNEHEPKKPAATRAQGGNTVEERDEELDNLPLPLQRITTRARLARQVSRNSLQSQGGR